VSDMEDGSDEGVVDSTRPTGCGNVSLSLRLMSALRYGLRPQYSENPSPAKRDYSIPKPAARQRHVGARWTALPHRASDRR
jgi:hypothetical protein